MRLRALRLTAIAHGILRAFGPLLPLDNLPASAAYSTRKLRTAYTGPALRVRRSSDNAEADIGFGADGGLDLYALTLHCGAPRRPLDTIAGAAAYSTRLVRSAYTGPCMRVRRSSDNAETDIGFTASGDLDTVALLNHCQTPRMPLDVVAGAAATYGLRLLRTAYAGPAVRVRRSSDNTELDIGFTASGDLDTVALLAFTGAGSGFVTTWYDQSGNGRDATQTTAANQPRIVNAGVLFVENGRPSIEYLGSQWLRFTSATNVFVGSIGAASVFALDAGTNARIISLVGATGLDWNTAGNAAFTRSGSAGAVEITSAGAQRSIQSYAIGTLAQASVTLGTSFAILLNGTAGTTSSGPALNSRTLTIGANGVGGENLTGAVSEVILLASAPSTTDRELLERSQSAYFGITYATALPSAFVTTWYDQSGSGRHATQGTAANQPRIVNAGVLQTLNGRPTVDQVTLNGRLNIPAFSGMTSAIVSAVYAQAAVNNGFAPWQLNQSDHLPWTNTLAYAGPFSATRPQFGGWSAAANELIVASAVQTGTALAIYRNGTQNGTTQASAFVLPSSQGNRTIFGGISGSGFVSELIVLSAWDGGTVNRQALERSQAAYFGITHVDSISGFVTTWYDQSGNALNAVQATAANQPRIVNAGVVDLLGSRPAVLANGSSHMTTPTITPGPVSVNGVVERDFVTATNRMWLSATPNSAIKLGMTAAADFYRLGFTSVSPTLSYTVGAPTVRTHIVQAGTNGLTPFRDGNAQSTGTSGPSSTAVPIILLASPTDSQSWIGPVAEIIVFTSALSTTDRQTLERNQGAYFGITVA